MLPPANSPDLKTILGLRNHQKSVFPFFFKFFGYLAVILFLENKIETNNLTLQVALGQVLYFKLW